MHAVQHGIKTRQIAERRSVSIDAVKFHIANALSKLGLFQRRSLQTWFSVPKHSALNHKEHNMSAKLQLGQIGQISRSVTDIDEAKRFFGEQLGLPHLFTFGNLAFFDCGGTRLMLEQSDESPAQSVLYFQVDDIVAAHSSLQGRGIEFTNPPHMIFRHEDGTEEWMAFFNDPDGRPLAVISQVK